MMIEKSDAALRRSRMLLHASEALSATSTTADVLMTVPALLRDTMGARHAAVVPAGPPGGAASAVSQALTRAAITDRRSQFYESAIDLTVEHPGLAEDLAHLGWQAAVCAPLPGESGAAT